MTELVDWLHQERETDSLHPLLALGVAIFVVVFLEIHPSFVVAGGLRLCALQLAGERG